MNDSTGQPLVDALNHFCQPLSLIWYSEPYNGTLAPHSPNDSRLYPTRRSFDEVDFPLCFQDVAIFYSISVVFALLVLLRFLCRERQLFRIGFTWLNISKIVLCTLLVVPSICDFGKSIWQAVWWGVATSDTPNATIVEHHVVAPVQIVTPIVFVVDMVLAILLILRERHLGVKSSGIQFVFWTVLLVYEVIRLRSMSLIHQDDLYLRKLETDRGGWVYVDLFRFVTHVFRVTLTLVQFVLVFIPDKEKSRMFIMEERPYPELSATFMSRITWWWLNGTIWRGYRRALEYTDLWNLNPEDRANYVGARFEREWQKEVKRAKLYFHGEEMRAHANERKGSPSLVWALTKAFGSTFFVAILFKVANDLLTFVSPQILKLIIQFVKFHTPEEVGKGYVYAVAIFVVAAIQSICLHQYFIRVMVVGMRLRTAVMSIVYKKSLLLTNMARRDSTTGEIVNLMSIDAQRFMDLTNYLNMVWSAPLQITLSIIFLYQAMGPSVFAGVAVMILLIPINAGMAVISRKFQVRQMKHKDARIKTMNEVLNGIKVIKLYSWENYFIDAILGIRNLELKVLRSSAFLSAVSSFTWTCAPFLVALATFTTYVLVNLNNPNERLTAEKAFVALSLFNILRFPVSMLPNVISNMVEASVSVRRLVKFLKNSELDPANVDYSPNPPRDGECAIDISNGKFTWEVPERPAVEKINLKVKSGQLVAIVGQVGAGKSSLLSAILGEMERVQGSVSVRGKVAYVPQQAWIQNNTVKGNILFGRPMDGTFYDRTLRACALGPDLEILPGGDMAEIGEKGVTLSGGQKQRVSIARAVYQKADIYLLDDPLSAVDAHVGKHIFNEIIGPDGLMSGKTRILVTHGLGFLHQCDLIMVLDSGLISEVGTYAELIEKNGAFSEFIRTYAAPEENEEGDPDEEIAKGIEEELKLADDDMNIISETAADSGRRQVRRLHLEQQRSSQFDAEPLSPQRPQPTTPLSPHEGKMGLVEQVSSQKSINVPPEKMDKGAAKNEDSHPIKPETAETGNVKLSVVFEYVRSLTWYMAFLILLFNLLANGLSVGGNFWLAAWSDREDKQTSISGAETGEDLGVYAVFGFGQALAVVIGSFALAIGAVLASGRIHDKLLRNVMRSPMSFFETTPLGRILNRFSKDMYVIDETIPRSIRTFIFVFLSVVNTLIVITVATPYFLIVIVPLLALYLVVQRIYVSTSRQLKRLESVSRSPIYSHFQETLNGVATIRAYRKQEEFTLDNESKVDYNQEAYYPGLCANRWLGIRLEFMGSFIVLFAALFAVLASIYPSISRNVTPGLAGLSISYALQITGNLNCIVRMSGALETNVVSVERAKEYSETPTEAAAIVEGHRPEPNWPQQGRVTFNNYSTRYREGLNLVLKGITCNIAGGEKVGIVGRTGAGKSSLTLALFRIVEPAGGEIVIDDMDVSTLGLHDLRSRITIIPQDPVLFSDTLRANLDPFNHYSDEDVWRCLETAHLKRFAQELPGGLEFAVAEGGENLSVGQRQLVCLARALLRKTKILVLDEATAAVDMETDDLIQKTIRNEFAGCTVVTIAHRLNTIMDYDRVMVLREGQIVEFDAPNQLLATKDLFYDMAKDAGLA